MTVIAHGAAPAAALAHAGPSPELLGGALPLLLVAAAVWALEHRQRAQGEAPGLVACGRAALRLAPELVGLALCGLAVGALLRRGENVAGAPATREDQELWAEIRGEWPVLSTADSLLGLAAVLRLLLLVSAELRGEEASATPFLAEPVLFMCLAAAARASLLLMSPKDVYHLDGPLGGNVNIALEVVAAFLLAHLAFGTLRRRAASLLAVAAGLLLVLPVALCNRLAIADPADSHLDALFSLSHLLELAAAAAFLARTLCAAGGGAFTALACFLLPLQQLLPAYFMLTAWGKPPLQEVPELVAAGRPFEVLQLCGLAQVALYVLASAMRLAIALEEKAADAYISI